MTTRDLRALLIACGWRDVMPPQDDPRERQDDIQIAITYRFAYGRWPSRERVSFTVSGASDHDHEDALIDAGTVAEVLTWTGIDAFATREKVWAVWGGAETKG